MSIRLVADDGTVFWITSPNWRRLLRYAGQHGWKWDRQLIPGRWKDGKMNEKYEFIGCARVESDAAQSLADAVARGVRDDPKPDFLLKELERVTDSIRKEHPTYDYDPTAHALTIVQRCAEFVPFARKGGFRVDHTD